MPPRSFRAAARALSFGESAERYDRIRPGYPATVIAALAPNGDETVLDVGCGTGKAALLFAARGCRVLGVDPDARMAKVASDAGIAVEIGTFEGWDPAGRRFDVVAAAQAWHWVDPTTGPAKAGTILNDRGRLAILCNYRYLSDEHQRSLLHAVYRDLAPELIEASPLLGTVDDDAEITGHATAITGSGSFAAPVVLRERWAVSYSVADWMDLTRTTSDHARLSPEQLGPLLHSVEEALAKYSSTLAVEYETVTIVAERSG